MVKVLCIGDAMIRGESFANAAMNIGWKAPIPENWELDWNRLQNRRLIVEQQGPGAETVPTPCVEHADAEVVFGLFAPFSSTMMDKMPNLRLIGVARAGVENVDIKSASDRGILVVNVLGRNAEAVSDFAIGMMLSESRNIARAHHAIQSGNWRKSFSNGDYIPELRGKTIGIAGFGFIGRLVAEKLSGFRTRILAYDPWVDPNTVPESVTLVDKEQLFAESDFITLHARLTEDSKGLVGARELSSMKKTAYLINTARSGLVQTDALVHALAERRIAGAALDVFDVEPIPDDHPLRNLDNVTLTTHIAGTTTEALTRSPELLMEETLRVIRRQTTPCLKNPGLLTDPRVVAFLERAARELGVSQL